MTYNLTNTILMTIAETTPFIRQATGLWIDEDRYAFVNFIAANPDAGDVIPGTGGLRKIRWSRPSAAACGSSISIMTTRCRSFSC